jgi:oxygen-dependent protoporphyrinogen oxidase
VPRRETPPIDGVTYTASLFDRETHTVALGADDRVSVGADDTTLTDAALRGFETVTDASADPVAVHRWPRGVPARDGSFDALDELSLPDGLHLATNYTARTGVTGRLRQARRVADRLTRSSRPEGTTATTTAASD